MAHDFPDLVWDLPVVLGEGVAIDVHRGGDLAVADALAGGAEVHAIRDHERDVRVAQLVEAEPYVVPAHQLASVAPGVARPSVVFDGEAVLVQPSLRHW